jgi:transcriptional regulator of heat shock response
MDVRKRLILKEIVDHYIRTGKAVSSQTILEKIRAVGQLGHYSQ